MTQHDSYTGVPISEARFFGETGWPRRLDGESILEVGCGSGRFTTHAADTGATVVAMDYSVAVDANHAANGHRANVLIVQGDLYDMPFPPGSFDRLFCFGVLQHTPDVRRSFHSLAKVVRGSGALVIDVYRKPSALKRLLTTKYWVRPLTRRMPAGALYRITAAYVSLMWPLVRIVDRVPRFGAKIVSQLLVADYREIFPLPDHLLREWAILDTFDMLSPTYDNPQTLRVVREWFSEAGFTDAEVKYGYNGIEGKGTKSAQREISPARAIQRP